MGRSRFTGGAAVAANGPVSTLAPSAAACGIARRILIAEQAGEHRDGPA